MAPPQLGPSTSEGETAATTRAHRATSSAPGKQDVSSALKEDTLPTEEKKDDHPDIKDPDNYWYMPEPIIRAPKGAQHGKGGVFYAGNWLDIEDCDKVFNISEKDCSGCNSKGPCPRSQSRPQPKDSNKDDNDYDVLIIGAGCIGAAIARELSKYSLSTLWVEAADDVSQGATKGNSGIVHAGYDDTPGTNHAKFCWPGNQMFAQLDKELRFGYQKNGSLVIAFNDQEIEHLHELKKRGETNGVQNLKIVHQAELKKMEPHINPKAIAALYSPDAGNVIPYEYAIALAENAVDNGVELRIRREVQSIHYNDEEQVFTTKIRHWEPEAYVESISAKEKSSGRSLFDSNKWLNFGIVFVVLVSALALLVILADRQVSDKSSGVLYGIILGATGSMAAMVGGFSILTQQQSSLTGSSHTTPGKRTIVQMVEEAGPPVGTGNGGKVEVKDMLIGGSGSSHVQRGVTVEMETILAKYIINCAGGASDSIARMIGDDSFKIKPRLGDYLLLHRNQGKLAKHTLFPCPDPILGKGVLVQTTLWGNLILGPTARDIYKPEAMKMTPKEVQEYILSKCKNLVPDFDPKETIHAFCGARAKSDRGDWIIEPSTKNPNMIHVAGIDSPGLAGSPAIALEVVRLLRNQSASVLSKYGMKVEDWMKINPAFNPKRAPIITPKDGMRGLKISPVGKNDSDGSDEAKMAANVICKCERVTELEVVRAMRRSLPIDSSQAIRKRTRAGMGHCQADKDNYNCEGRVRAIIARELGNVPLSEVAGRPWPATSTLTQRWIDDEEKAQLEERMKVS